MAEEALFSGSRITMLIPQREPIVMLDTFFEGSDNDALTGLTVQPDQLFCVDGRLTEPGLIEHMAQSASALAGYKAYRQQKKPPLGFIGEIKKFRTFRLPASGEQLRTHIQVVSEVLQIQLISAEVTSAGEPIASCRMKIYVQE
ncbi:MAG: hydroxymyristoyl-ACP dehydratase [Tannerella sp.]|jgi:predicted hotdog family 3-hydroxylacyl-ACP dehydratase|nr:hydroxymyristoyl-ACP dehydratase [Tannerella sp.]